MEVYALLKLRPGGDRMATASRLRRSGSGVVLASVPPMDDVHSTFGVGVSDFDVAVQVRDLPVAAAAIAAEPVDAPASCVVAGPSSLVFDDVVSLRFLCLIERADGLEPAEFAHAWQHDFVQIVRATPGQISYEQLVVDRAETAAAASALGIPATGADGLAIGGFADRSGLEGAIAWANVDESHREATSALFAPRYRKILADAHP